MAEVLAPPAATASPSPRESFVHDDPSTSTTSTLSPVPRSQQHREQQRTPASYAQQSRMSHYSQHSAALSSRPPSHVFPAFASSLPYALVRDFAYPVFHPMHYGAEPEVSGASTPNSEWNPSRRQSDPVEQWGGGGGGGAGGWSAGPWGGDGVVMHGREHEENDDEGGESLPSTYFASGDAGVGGAGDDDGAFGRNNKHRKSKSYANISDYERGRRRESGRADASHLFHSQQGDLAGRDSLRLSRGYSGAGGGSSSLESGAGGGARRDSPFASTLPNRSFHTSTNTTTPQQPPPATSTHDDPDDAIPLDTEPHHASPPERDSLGPEDEDLFAGPSLALYSFEPENSNELRLVEGQEILVSYRHGQGWLVAFDPRSGEQGLVPEAYVRLIADIPGYDPATGQFVEVESGEEVEEDEEDEAGEDLEMTPAKGAGHGNSGIVRERDAEADDDDDNDDAPGHER